jgi:hypothetical protein
MCRTADWAGVRHGREPGGPWRALGACLSNIDTLLEVEDLVALGSI